MCFNKIEQFQQSFHIMTEKNLKVYGICLQSNWKQAVVYRKQLQFFVKHRLKIPRYYLELQSNIRQHNFIDNDRMFVRHVIHVLDSSKFANAMMLQLDDEIQRVKKNIYLIKAGLIQWKADYLSQDMVERIVVTYLQYEKQGRIQLNFDVINSLLKSAKLVICREVFDLWCEKCRRLLRQPNVIAIDEFLYLAPNFISVDQYIRKVARRQKNKDMARQCMSSLSLNCNLVKQLGQDLKQKQLVYEGKQISVKQAEIDLKCQQILENQNISVDKLKDFLNGACTSHHKYRVSQEQHEKSLLNGIYVRNQIIKQVRTGSARLQLDPFANLPPLLTMTSTNRSSLKTPGGAFKKLSLVSQHNQKVQTALQIVKQELQLLNENSRLSTE